MNINFNISGSIGATFISASRWNYGFKPAISDDMVIKRSLKKYIADINDKYTRYIAVGSKEEELASIESQKMLLMNQLFQAQQHLESATRDFEKVFTPTDPNSI